jgi:hypothetical protein
MTKTANPLRGEATLEIAGKSYVMRPSFAALVCAEEELGSLFALVERAGEGNLRLNELAVLFWHCLETRETLTRDLVGEAVLSAGLAQCTKPLKVILGEILRGRG